MDTPTSPPPQHPTYPKNPPSTSPSPQPHFPKRGLPSPPFTSAHPHGLITNQPRSPTQQAALDSRKAEILQTMSRKEIERAYEEVVGRIREEVEEGERRAREVEGEIEKLRMEREMERRVWGKLTGAKLRGLKEGGG